MTTESGLSTKSEINPKDIPAYRRALAEQSFWDFLDYVYILDPPPKGEGLVKFVKWPHLKVTVKALGIYRLITWLKARQIGATWLVTAYGVWTAMYQEGAGISLTSQGEEEAKEMLRKCKVIYENLPGFLKVPLTTENLTEMRWGHAYIKALASTKKAGRSLTGSLIIMDEADFHEYFSDDLNAIKPTIDSTGGQLIALSTPDYESVDSPFKRLWEGAPSNGWHPIYYAYDVRPGRDEAWRAARENEAEDPAKFEKEYSRTAQEALSPPKTLQYFSHHSLTALRRWCREPDEVRDGLIRIWKRPLVGEKYLAFGDIAWGEKGAFSCCPIVHYPSFEQVAEIYGRPNDEELARAMYELCTEYNKAYLGVEANGEGMKVVNLLINLNYGDHMYHRAEDWRTNPKSRGWWTDQFHRKDMLSDLRIYADAQQIRPMCEDAISEMMNTVRDDQNHVGASRGGYFDHVMAWAGMLQMRKYARFTTTRAGAGKVSYAYS